jgi:hypothetical protein
MMISKAIKITEKKRNKPNSSICKASMRIGLIQLQQRVSVSALDEKTCSLGTDDVCMGRKSRAMA